MCPYVHILHTYSTHRKAEKLSYQVKKWDLKTDARFCFVYLCRHYQVMDNILYTRRPFIAGLLSLFSVDCGRADIVTTLNDATALASDWEAVGNDMSNAITSFSQCKSK